MVARVISSENNFGFVLADISRLARKEFDRRVRDLGLTRAQWLVLLHLVRQPGCTQSDLAESLQMQKITVSRHVSRMLRAGWIERRDHASDRRAYHLHVAQKTEPLIERLGAVADELRGEFMHGLTEVRREALMTDLLHIKSNLVRMDTGPKRRSHDAIA
jgi:MarR family transcriptional regulator, transcriptional regulator for hemolysin